MSIIVPNQQKTVRPSIWDAPQFEKIRAILPDMGVNVALVLLALVIIKFMLSKTDGYLEVFFVILQVVPAYILSMTGSKKLLPYILFIWAVGPEVRRFSDWSYGAFQPVTILSLTPMLSTLALLIPIYKARGMMSSGAKTTLKLLFAAITYGSMIGALHNGFAVFYELATYVIPLLIFTYLACDPMSLPDRDKIYASLGSIAVGVAIYCWVEYLIVPPWDGFWMLTCKPIMGSIGHPQPMNLRPWSTLNAPGPCAAFLAVSLAPMMVEKRWRGPFGWLGVVLIASALAITFVRTSYIELMLMIIVYLALSNGKNMLRTGIGVAFIVVALIVITPHLPGGDKVASRFSTIGDLGNDQSVKARTEFSGEALGRVAMTPLGSGLGTIGESTKLNSGGKFGTDDVVFDNGYLGVGLTYGIIGCIMFYGGILAAALYAWRTQRQFQDPYTRLSLAGVAGLAFALTSGNAVVLVTGVMFWTVIAAAFAPHSAQVYAMLQQTIAEKRRNGIF